MTAAGGLAKHRGLIAAVVLASLGVAYQHQRFARAGARYDRFDLPGFDAHVYVAMATRPSVFTVAPWGYRLLTPALVEAWPVRTVRAFRDVSALALVLTAALLAALAFSLSGPVAEAVQYRFLVEPVTAALAAAFLLALASGAPVAALALVATLGALSKEFFLLLPPLVLIERQRLVGPGRALRDAVLVAVPAVAATALLRVGWTPYLESPLPRPGAALVATALERFSESFPEWRGALLLGGLLPLAVVGAWLPKGRPRLAASAYLFLVTLLSPFLNPVAFFPRDVPRLLLYALPAVLPLALVALDRLVPHLGAPSPPRPPRSWVAWSAGAALLAAIGFTWSGLDAYRRADLQGPRDGPLVLAVCRESLRTASRLARGEAVSFDLADPAFVWGETPLHRFDRMRWFLREGWGVRPQYGAGDAVMEGPQAQILVPILEARGLDVILEMASDTPGRVAAFVNGQRVGDAGVGSEATAFTFRLPATALFRGDNLLTLVAPAGTRVRRLRLKPA